MKVKVGDTVYDSETGPVMVILSDQDKFNISHMAADATKYCAYPDTCEPTEISKWMKEGLDG